jgi:hypothetical protein
VGVACLGDRGIVVRQEPNLSEGFDTSVNLYASGVALVKGSGFYVSAQDLPRGRTTKRRPKPDALWLRASGSKAIQPTDGKYLPAEDPPEAVMYGTSDFREVLALLGAITDEQPVQVGFKFPDEPVERVYYGPAKLGDAETTQLHNCFGELLQASKKSGSE